MSTVLFDFLLQHLWWRWPRSFHIQSKLNKLTVWVIDIHFVASIGPRNLILKRSDVERREWFSITKVVVGWGGGREDVKPWPNGVASYRKLKTCDGLLEFVMPCDDLRHLWWSSNHASERKFLTVWPPNTSRRKLALVLFSSVRARFQGCTEMAFAFLLLALNLRLIAGPFGHPSQVCWQVHIS